MRHSAGSGNDRGNDNGSGGLDTGRLDARTWPAMGGGTLVVPLGALEQHGPHLPLGTDCWIAERVAAELVPHGGSDLILAPPIPYGASGEHEDFPGTISIGTDALALVLIEFGRSASRWADRLLFVNGHGGNVDALRGAIPRLRGEGFDAAWASCEGEAAAVDAHAGRAETSLMLALVPESVRTDRLEAGAAGTLRELLPEMRAHGVRHVSPNGVLGDPTGATAEEGRRALDAILEEMRGRMARWRVREDGMLAPR